MVAFQRENAAYKDDETESIGDYRVLKSYPSAVVCPYNEVDQIIYVADTGNDRVIKLKVEQNEPGNTPLEVFEAFKMALRAGDAERALTFIAEISRDTYSEIYEAVGPDFQDYVNGMGQMTLVSIESGTAKYDMVHVYGSQTYKFPVLFIKEADGNWRILKF